jgi:hypothetical protein
MRKYTTELLELMNCGALSGDRVLDELLNWLPESQVEAFCKTNDAFSELFEEDSEEEEESQDEIDEDYDDYMDHRGEFMP